LEKLLKDRGDPPDDELLFPAEGGGLLDPDGISAAFRAARDTAGVRPLRLHDLRHTYCSRLAMRGVPLWRIAQWAGHVSTQTTEIYAHYAPSDSDAETVDEAFAVAVEKNGSGDPNMVETLLAQARQLTELAEVLAQRERE
jgi:integrase